jgi:hypothetical protein
MTEHGPGGMTSGALLSGKLRLGTEASPFQQLHQPCQNQIAPILLRRLHRLAVHIVLLRQALLVRHLVRHVAVPRQPEPDAPVGQRRFLRLVQLHVDHLWPQRPVCRRIVIAAPL